MPPPVYLKPTPLHPYRAPRFNGYKERHGWTRRVAANPPVTSPSAAGCKIRRRGTGNRFRARGLGKGLAGFPEVWWMRITSGSGALGPGEKGFLPPARKWAGVVGPERERERNGWVGGNSAQQQHTMDSSNYHHRREDEEGKEVQLSSCSSNDKQQQRLMTLPTILTLGRIAAVPLLVSTFHMDGRWATNATTIIFLAAAITDWLDGFIARKMRLGTIFGAFLDPVADKLMVAATLVLLCTTPLEVSIFGQVPWFLTVPSIAIIGREITMSAVREWAASQNSRVLEAVAVNNLGKWKTATQMTSLTILLAARDSSLSGSGVVLTFGVVLLYISSGLAIWSLAVYMKKIWRILLK